MSSAVSMITSVKTDDPTIPTHFLQKSLLVDSLASISSLPSVRVSLPVCAITSKLSCPFIPS